MARIKTIGVLTSGGDAPGMNAAIRAVTRAGICNGYNIKGIYRGYDGLINGEIEDFTTENVSGIIMSGGTILKTARSKEFMTDEGKAKAYEQIQAQGIDALVVIGGNGSLTGAMEFAKMYDICCIGLPGTIDNDLYGTDHCPGYASAAKYIATTVMEVNLDAKVYDTPMVCVIEAMGRHAGWLTAAAALAGVNGLGADLIYLPESDFDVDKFVEDVKAVCAKNGNKCIAVVSEGIHDKNGTLICESLGAQAARDSFGHAQLGGVASILANLVKQKTGFKTRGIELSLMQRCGAHLASETDVEEAFNAGAFAVKSACEGETDKMVIFKRVIDENGNYHCENVLMPLELAANTEKKVPAEWITNDGTYVSDEFVKYALPLIQGDAKAPLENGLPRFARLKKVYAGK